MEGVVPQLEPPTFEESVIAAFKGLPGVLASHQTARGVIIVKLRCPSHQGRGLDEIIPQLKQAFLLVWELDRSSVRWLSRVQYRLPMDDIVDGKLCRTWMLSSLPCGMDWHYPWDGQSPGLFPKEYLADPRCNVLLPHLGMPWDVWHGHATDFASYQRMRDYQTQQHRHAAEASAVAALQAGAARLKAFEQTRQEAMTRMSYQVPDAYQREMAANWQRHSHVFDERGRLMALRTPFERG
jgi:hypothetical protein